MPWANTLIFKDLIKMLLAYEVHWQSYDSTSLLTYCKLDFSVLKSEMIATHFTVSSPKN